MLRVFLNLSCWMLAFAGLAGTANAALYTNVLSASYNFSDPSDWNPAGPPTINDTAIITGCTTGVTTPIGNNVSVYALNTDPSDASSTTFRINNTGGGTLTIGGGGIQQDQWCQQLYPATHLQSCIGRQPDVDQFGGTIMLDRNSLAFNNYGVTVVGAGTLDYRMGGIVAAGTNLIVQSAFTMASSQGTTDLQFNGNTNNSFKSVTIAAGGTLEGTTFPADTAATTTSSFGNASSGTITLGGNGSSATIIYNGNTAATPKTITMDARNTGADTINVTTAGQTLTLTNLLYTQGTSQYSNVNWNFGGAGNYRLRVTLQILRFRHLQDRHS